MWTVTKLVLLLTAVFGVTPSHGFSAEPASAAPGIASATTQILIEELVRDQLGYLPSNYVRASAWKKVSNENIPVAIQTYPLNGGAKRRQNKARLAQDQSEEHSQQQPIVQSPFPTLFWLTCPDISKAVANLERRGFVQIFEDELNSKPDLAKRLFRCHEEYAQLRWKSLTEKDRNVLTSSSSSSPLTPSLQRMRNMMECSGISGTNFTDISSWDKDYNKNQEGDLGSIIDAYVGARNVEQEIRCEKSFSSSEFGGVKVPPIKCLHAHYAHYRSTVWVESTIYINPVGELIQRELEKEFPHLDL
uniref:Uncharacterized protein n=1 Tax=Pseudo-nitzschia australis TaxID=44445 RepID=A0A7S4EMQ5_9STRA|mmetsp:Transcript_27593/g.60762  ORF Transcript_27593/g.60762 Transcript_27593/m.60762 type:complete len:304 (-) Transcript_27593:331-1242(-)